MPSVEEQTTAQSNGAPTDSGEIVVQNPATGEVAGTVPDLDAKAVADMAARARAAQPAWEALGFDGRAQVFKRAQRWVIDNSDRLVATIVSETGKALEDAQLAEVGYVAGALGFWAKKAPAYLADERMFSHNPLVVGRRLVVRNRPRGLIGTIGPWNYPLSNSFGDCIPALAAGNAVILKPSEVTPLTSLVIEEGLRECGMPEHVFQVATGRGETGAALIDLVDFVAFTGSTRTGRKVMERAAQNLTPVSLELGGKDPMIVLADADIERAANVAVYYSMQNAGQTCISIERCYVEEPVYDEFIAKVTEKVSALRQGKPGEAGSIDIGSLTFPPQLDIVERHVADAISKGAHALVGGKRGDDSTGLFFQPTVLVDVDHTMQCMTEETFGPTLPVMKVRDAEEAIRLANDSQYGLAASVFTRDTERGQEIARRLEAGSVCVNDAVVNYLILDAPMGGVKNSGIGARHGPGGIRKYCLQQTILITPRMTLKREPHMFPYSKRMTKMLGRMLKLLYGRGSRK